MMSVYDCHCCEAAIESCSADSCQGPCSGMELPGKKGWPEPLRWRRGAEGRHPEEETPQPVTLRACNLNDDHSRNSYRLHWESVPQEHYRIAQKDFAACRGMAGMNLTFQLLTFQHRQSRWSDVPLGPANTNTPLGVPRSLAPKPNSGPEVMI